MEKAPQLRLAITAGIGSDHVDLNAAKDHNLTVGEATGGTSNLALAPDDGRVPLSMPGAQGKQCASWAACRIQPALLIESC